MKPELFRVALIGPESSGKTTICTNLAEYYNTRWVPEFSRDYIASLRRPYIKEDIFFCIEQQLKSEEIISKTANRFLFADTELIVAKVWLLDVFNECPDWIENKIEETKYDLYLLTKPDLPFIKDPVRENPNRRQFFYEWYKKELENRKFNYKIIEGMGKGRFDNAINCLNIDFHD